MTITRMKVALNSMITVQVADSILNEISLAFPQEDCLLLNSLDRVLAEDLLSDRPQPPFNRVAMDGIAICYEAWDQGKREFLIQDIQAAGVPAVTLAKAHACVEVMTGAVCPEGTDTVIPVEQISMKASSAILHEDIILRKGQNIHAYASDGQMSDVLVKAGTVLKTPHIAIAASLGKTSLSVVSRPKIAMVATGDELVPVSEAPEPYQIRVSNISAAEAFLKRQGFENLDVALLKDDRVILQKSLKSMLEQSQVLILSGGVSKGKFDYIPEVLEELGVKQEFHRVAQRPGKPLWFGRGPQGQVVFGVPGNPVSFLICLYRYIWPMLQRMMGVDVLGEWMELLEDVSFMKPMTLFLPVQVLQNGVRPIIGNGSGDFVSLGQSDGFVELSSDQDIFKRGTSVQLYRWRQA